MLSEQKNTQSLSLHLRTSSNHSDDYDLSHKVYRALLTVFIDNLNAFVKTHQNCINDLDEHPRVRAHNDDLKYVENGLKDIYPKHLHKISKESLYRNTNLKQQYSDFVKQYQPLAHELQQQQSKNKSFASSKTKFINIVTHLNNHPSNSQQKKIRKWSLNNEGIPHYHSQRITHQTKQNSFICRLSEFKAFESQQVIIACDTDQQKIQKSHNILRRIKKGSMVVKTSEDRIHSKEKMLSAGIDKDQAVISEVLHHEEEDWEVDTTSELKKHNKVVLLTPRIFTLKSKTSNNPQFLPRMDMLRQSKNLWVSAVQPQGYQGYRTRSRDLSKVLSVK